MNDMTEGMAHEYARIQKRATEDPGTAGDQGEENWATLLRDWLPPTYQVVTKGRILSHTGIAGPQVDVLVLLPTYPRKLLDKKLYLAGGIAAAFECKVTLDKSHIFDTMRNAVAIRRHLPKRSGTPYRELHSPLVYGLLAHSHGWKGPNSTPIENVDEHLFEADSKIVTHPHEMLDLVCVSDLACWMASKRPFTPINTVPNLATKANSNSELLSAHLLTGYTLRTSDMGGPAIFAPVGVMLMHLLRMLAFEDPTIRSLAQYFHAVESNRFGKTNVRTWQADVYSDEIRAGIPPRTGSSDIWDEWGGWAWAF